MSNLNFGARNNHPMDLMFLADLLVQREVLTQGGIHPACDALSICVLAEVQWNDPGEMAFMEEFYNWEPGSVLQGRIQDWQDNTIVVPGVQLPGTINPGLIVP